MSVCLSAEQLSDLLADSLSTTEWDILARHVEACASCQGRLARLSGTPIAESWLRAEQPAEDSEAEDEFVRRLQRMRPPSDNSDGNPTLMPTAHAPLAGDRTPAGTESEWPAVPGYELHSELGRGGM